MHGERRPGASIPPTARGVALAVAAALLAPAASRAQACATFAGADPALASVPVERRIAWLRARLDGARPAAEAWTWTWGAVDGAFTAGQLAAVPFQSTAGWRWVLASGAISSALGVVQVVTLPVVPERVPAGGGCGELSALEESLARGARNARLASGRAAQLGNVLVNAALGGGAALADRSWKSGAVTFGIGWAIGEVQILSTPKALARDLERYRAGDLDAAAARPRARIAWAASVGVRSGGASLVLRF